MAKLVGCPGCGEVRPEDEWDVDVRDMGLRETRLGTAQVNSFGYRCSNCGTNWGHAGGA